MVKIRNVFGDEYKGRQGNAVYQKFYGRQIRRLWDGKKENTAPQQEEQKRRFRVGLAFWESLSREEREALKEYLRGIGSDLTAQQWAVKVALSRPRVVVQSEEVLANLVEWVEGWDAIGWPYRQKITLTNDLSTDLVGYQKLLELDASKVGPHFRWDLLGADLRFYDDQGNKLSYWVEEWDKENKTAKVWVRVSRIPAQGSTSIKMYYGNAQAESESDGEAVFEFFDDFEGDSLDTSKWDIKAVSGDNGKQDSVSISDVCVQNGYVWLDCQSRNINVGIVEKVKDFSPPYIAETKVRNNPDGLDDDAVALIFAYQDEKHKYHAVICFGDTGWGASTSLAGDNPDANESWGEPVRTTPKTGDWHIIRVDFYSANGTTAKARYYLDGRLISDASTSDPYYDTGKVGVGSFGMQNGAHFDWVRVRKYAEQEPGVEFGAEEQGQVVTHEVTTVTVKAIEHPAIKDVRVFDEDGNEVWRAEGLTDIASGKVTSRVRLPDEVVSKGVRALVRSAAGTVDVVNL